jgi:hypothetical protein
MRVLPARWAKPMVLRLWGSWIDRAGVEQAWQGNSAVYADEISDHAFDLHFNLGGFADPTFDDLNARLTLSNWAWS